MPNGRSAVVVGAGLSGLAAARRLQQAGYHVAVLEREAFPGGRVRTERHDPYLVDTGPDALTASYVRYLGLLDELGLAGRLVRSSQVIGLVRNGRVVDVDVSKPWTLPTNRQLSLRGKAALLRGLIRIRHHRKGVDAYDLVAAADFDDPRDNAERYGQAVVGREVADYVVDPAMRLVAGSGAAEVSRLGLIGAINSWSVPLMNVRGGLDLLPKALAGQLDVRYNSSATRVREHADGVTVDYTDGTGEQSIEADACVIGAMYNVAREIWEPLDGYAPEFAPKLRNVAFVHVSLGYSVPTQTQAYVVQVPSVEEPDLLQIFMEHHKSPDRAPAGRSLVTLYTDDRVTARYIDRSDDEIIDWAARKIETICPELAGQRDLALVHRWPCAGYLAAPGFWRQSRGLLTGIPDGGRVRLAGDLFGAGSMESAVAWGERAAASIVHTQGGWIQRTDRARA